MEAGGTHELLLQAVGAFVPSRTVLDAGALSSNVSGVQKSPSNAKWRCWPRRSASQGCTQRKTDVAFASFVVDANEFGHGAHRWPDDGSHIQGHFHGKDVHLHHNIMELISLIKGVMHHARKLEWRGQPCSPLVVVVQTDNEMTKSCCPLRCRSIEGADRHLQFMRQLEREGRHVQVQARLIAGDSMVASRRADALTMA